MVLYNVYYEEVRGIQCLTTETDLSANRIHSVVQSWWLSSKRGIVTLKGGFNWRRNRGSSPEVKDLIQNQLVIERRGRHQASYTSSEILHIRCGTSSFENFLLNSVSQFIPRYLCPLTIWKHRVVFLLTVNLLMWLQNFSCCQSDPYSLRVHLTSRVFLSFFPLFLDRIYE